MDGTGTPDPGSRSRISDLPGVHPFLDAIDFDFDFDCDFETRAHSIPSALPCLVQIACFVSAEDLDLAMPHNQTPSYSPH